MSDSAFSLSDVCEVYNDAFDQAQRRLDLDSGELVYKKEGVLCVEAGIMAVLDFVNVKHDRLGVCPKCYVGKGEEDHYCSFDTEINEDILEQCELCNCCDACQDQCAEDV